MDISGEDYWRQALLEAADFIEANGWTPNPFNHGPQCMVGALAKVCVYSKPFGRAFNELKNMLGIWPTDWNLMPGRTREEVVSALRQCAERSAAPLGA